MNKKSQGLSVNLIIIVAIALIILVVVIAIFTGRMGGFVGGLDESKSCVSACAGLNKGSDDDATCAGGQKLPGTFEDADDCCCL
ncbi:MAG: hypothetical protein QGH34_00165 [Candidatus Woesearchaeota archaeon]|nr:hypothetical protein [Candidatus Woesearchaeota archaeon]